MTTVNSSQTDTFEQLEEHQLRMFFNPKTVAVVGATEKKGGVGRTIMENLLAKEFKGKLYPINPKRDEILGVKAYKSLSDVPEKVDLVVIVIPATSVPAVISECVQLGIKSCIIISAGFKEIGAEGIKLEKTIIETAEKGGMRIIGPNCLGLMCPITGVNATFASKMANPGNVGFISQSGALCTAILDWSFSENVGFSAFISIGSMLDVDWGDLIGYLGQDPNTKSIVIYMESIGDARSFLSAAREVALLKPIIVIKAGRSDAAAKAAASHTGALTGSDEVLDAAFRRSGVVRVNEISDIFYLAEVLAKQPRPKGPNLTMLTNAGGPGVLATDALIIDGGKLTEITEDTIHGLNELLPSHWSHSNPIDILGDAEPERYAKSLEIAAKDANSDGLLVILTPQAMTDPTKTAEKLIPFSKIEGKPVLASWMGGNEVNEGKSILNKNNIPTFAHPDIATRIFNYMWKYSYNIKALYETPALPRDFDDGSLHRTEAEEIIRSVRNSGRTLMTEYESKKLLDAYGIPTVSTNIALNQEDACKMAGEIGYPVVMKLNSRTITHKTDVGGVILNIKDAESVKQSFKSIENSVSLKAGKEHFHGVTIQPMVKLEGYEIIIGSSLDPQFGPVLLFGTGGQLVEVFKDRSLGLPPLNSTLAKRMMEQTKIYKALKGVRGRKSVDMAALEQLLVRFSQLVAEQKWIKEIDINPLLASPEQLIALDARVVLHPLEMKEEELPETAIRPYPKQYVGSWTLKDGTSVMVRPIRPEDEPLMIDFHETLSENSVYLHYTQKMDLSKRIEHERLTRVCFNDYDREIALVADILDPETLRHKILASVRLSKIHGSTEGKFVLLVSDPYQGKGLGTELFKRIIKVAKDEKLTKISANILSENKTMQDLCKKLGFKLYESDNAKHIRAEIIL